MKRILLALAGMLLAGAAQAACPTTTLTFKDAAGATQTLCFGGAAGQFVPQHQILDSAGVNILAITAGGAAKVDGSATTQPVSGTVTANAGTGTLAISAASLPLPTGAATAAGLTTINTTLGTPFQAGGALAANQSVNETQLNGVAVAVGTGLSGTGVQRFVLATDQPQLTNHLLVTPDANSAVNLNQVGGAAVALGQAAMAASVPVAIASNQSAISAKVTGNAGAILDFAGQNVTQPANSLLTGCAFNTVPTTVTTGNATQIQCDNAGNTLVKINAALPAGSSNIGSVNQGTTPWVNNITQIGGSAVALGQNSMSASVPVAIANNQSTLQENVAQIAGGTAGVAGQTGSLQVGGAVAAAGLLSSATFPMMIGGSDYGGTAHAQIWKVDSTGLGYINCANCTGSSQTDTTTFGPTAAQFGPVGGFFQTTATNNALGNLQQGALQVTAQRALFTNLRNASGTEIGTLSSPIATLDTLAIGSTTSGQTGGLVMGAVTTAAPSYTTGQTDPLSLDTAGNLRINCITGCSSSGGTGVIDESAFTANTTALTLGGGFFQTSATTNPLTTGQSGAFQVTANRALFTNLRNASGTEIGTSSNGVFVSQTSAPWTDNITQIGGNGVTSGGVNGTLAVGGNQAAGSVISTNVNPQLIGGSDYAATPRIQTFKVDSTGLGYISCSNCSGSGLAQTDGGGFTPGTPAVFAQAGGFFQTVATNNQLGNLTYGAFQVTQNRALFTNLRNASGAEVGVAAAPLQVSVANTAANATPIAGNITQVGGSSVQTGVGPGGAGIPRVTVSNDSSLAANQSVNVNQIAGVAAVASITPNKSTALEGHRVLKVGAGNLYSVYVTTGATPGFLMTFNATTAPADGAVTPVDCVPATANSTTAISHAGSPPDAYSTGITVVFSTTGCFSKVESATVFFKGRVI